MPPKRKSSSKNAARAKRQKQKRRQLKEDLSNAASQSCGSPDHLEESSDEDESSQDFRRVANRERIKQARQMQTDEQKEARLERDRVATSQCRENETAEEHQARLEQVRVAAVLRREDESVEERQARLEQVRVATSQRREGESVEENQARLEQVRVATSQRREGETVEENQARLEQVRVATSQRREGETVKENQARLEQVRVATSQHREGETVEQSQARLEQVRVATSQRREGETVEENQARLEQVRVATSQRREGETVEQSQARLEQARVATSQRREDETVEESQVRLSQLRVAASQRREDETEQQREVRLTRDRDAAAARRQDESSDEEEARRTADRQQHEAERRRARQQGPSTACSAFIGNAAELEQLEAHSLGQMNVECNFCGALHFQAEKRRICCHNGKVSIPSIDQPPDYVVDLFTNRDSQESRNFQDHIRNYNSALAMASWNANINQLPGRGPPVVTIHGQTYHTTSNLLPEEGQQPQFCQLYALDSRDALQQRMSVPANVSCMSSVMQRLQETLLEVNPFAQRFCNMAEALHDEEAAAEAEGREPLPVRMVISHNPGEDVRRFNDPTAHEIAAIFVGEEGVPPNPSERQIVIRPRSGRALETISPLDPNCDPMTYPLFFFKGQLGWQSGLRHEEEHSTGCRKTITLRQWYAFMVSCRVSFSPLHHGKLLFQQYVVDAFCKVEGSDLNFIRRNQRQLRAETYLGLVDHMQQRATEADRQVGRMVILPSTFCGSPRYNQQNLQDAMTLVRKYGRPDLFLTMTANPRWKEIELSLSAGQQPCDRPDVVVKAFVLKLKEVLHDIIKGQVFGKVIAYVYTIEFQKRGLPHCHALFMLAEEFKPRTATEIDQIISAELPDPEVNPKLFAAVKRHMVHGPCGAANPSCVCMVDGKCSKAFPKLCGNETIADVNGYPQYRRRCLHLATFRQATVDDSFVVPYNPMLLLKYDCHINVEIATSVKVTCYLFKYIYKGFDCSTVEIREGFVDHDEVLAYISARYVGPHEALYRLFENKMHDNSHTIVRLAVHLPLMEMYYFRQGDEAAALNRERVTTLLAWFRLNQNDPEAHEFLYHEIPEHYTFAQGRWRKRRRFTDSIIGRMYFVQPTDNERFHLRLILLHKKGATSFENLKTVNDVTYATFKEAATAMRLTENDQLWRECLQEGAAIGTPSALRRLFCLLLTICHANSPSELWDEFRGYMVLDFLHRNPRSSCPHSITANEVDYQHALADIQRQLVEGGMTLESFGLPSLDENLSPMAYHPNEIPDTDIHNECQDASLLEQQLNVDQKAVFDEVVASVENDGARRCFYIDGAGGTGKTFLYKAITLTLKSRGKQVICVAWSGIASTLLVDGRTAHSTFKLPMSILPSSTSSMTANSYQARKLRNAAIIIWDEASMVPASALKIVNVLLQDICSNDLAFGGKVMVLGGDFRQVLPVVERGCRAQIVSACLKSSNLWRLFHPFRLSINMRVQEDAEQSFSNWLLDVGDGKLTSPVDEGSTTVLPEDMCITGENSLQSLVDHVFGNGDITDINFISKRCILTPKNDSTHVINDLVLQRITSEEVVYFSIDSVESEMGNEANIYPTEFLNSLTPTGMPLHKLQLREGSTVILLRNLDPKRGLCNGTRLLVSALRPNVVKAAIIGGRFHKEVVLIPRIAVRSSNERTPFTLRRLQFPLRLAYAMTINKSQGQSLDHVGIYLPKPVFAHGQLYVALSRASSREAIKVVSPTLPHVRNVVYPEVLL